MLIQGIGAFIQCLPGSMAGPAVGKGLAASGGTGRGVVKSAQAPGLRKSCRCKSLKPSLAPSLRNGVYASHVK